MTGSTTGAAAEEKGQSLEKLRVHVHRERTHWNLHCDIAEIGAAALGSLAESLYHALEKGSLGFENDDVGHDWACSHSHDHIEIDGADRADEVDEVANSLEREADEVGEVARTGRQEANARSEQAAFDVVVAFQ